MEGEKVIREGLAEVAGVQGNDVFYNPVQCVNRDLSVAMIQVFIDRRAREIRERREHKEKNREENARIKREQQQKRGKGKAREARADKGGEEGEGEDKGGGGDKPQGAGRHQAKEEVAIFEALAASGLRSIRYFKELRGVDKVVVNDLDPVAVEHIRANVERNELPLDRVTPLQGDATLNLHTLRAQGTLFDVIDLDPYGSAAPFLDASVQCVSEGGLLCVTCTDLAVLCGKGVEVAYSRYGATPLRGKYMHESAVRIVLQSISQCASKYKRSIEVVGAFFIDFYLRCFVRVFTSPIRVKDVGCSLSYLYQCMDCPTFALQPVQRQATSKRGAAKYTAGVGPVVDQQCSQCQGRFHVGGPIWNQPLFDVAVLADVLRVVEERKDVLAQHKRVIGLLTAATQELVDVPLFYTVPALSTVLKCQNPPAIDVRSALVHAGFRVSQSHCESDAVKTDAPTDVVWDVMRAWVQKHPVQPKADSPAERILAKAVAIEVDFTHTKAAEISSAVPRFLPNPETGWGPKKAAAGGRFVGTKRRKADGVMCATNANLQKRAKVGDGNEDDGQGGEEGEAGDEPCQEGGSDGQAAGGGDGPQRAE